MYPVKNLFTFLDQFVKPLGDSSYQQNVWLSDESFVDYDEFTARFLERVEERIENPDKYEGMNEKIRLALKELNDRIEEFDDNVTIDIFEGRDDLIISHPEWQSIRKFAKETYDMIIEDLRKRGYQKDEKY